MAPSTGWMLYYLCFTPSIAIGPPLRSIGRPLSWPEKCRKVSKIFCHFFRNASLFTMFLFTIFAPLNLPPPNQQNDGFPLEFLLKGPETELRTLIQNCEQTLQKLRTNRIMNKRAFQIFDDFRRGPFPQAPFAVRWFKATKSRDS